MPRTRSRSYGYVAGHYLASTGHTGTRGYVAGFERIDDGGPGYHRDAALHIERFKRSGGIMNGSTHDMYVENLPVYPVGDGTLDPAFPIDIAPSDGSLAAKLMAETNPSSPDVDIMNFLGELRDFPRMLKIAGEPGKLKKLAGTNLQLEFGWKPLIADLFKMLDFQASVNARFKLLEKMRTEGYVLRKKTLYKNTKNRTYSRVLNSDLGIGVTGDFREETSTRIWGYMAWIPDASLPVERGDMMRLARTAALGLRVETATVWQLLPWSWLIDWFVNIGDLIEATRNVVPSHPGLIYLCEHRQGKTESTNIRVSSPNVTCSQVSIINETKARRLVSASLSASIPAITDRQAGILGSLAILRSRR